MAAPAGMVLEWQLWLLTPVQSYQLCTRSCLAFSVCVCVCVCVCVWICCKGSLFGLAQDSMLDAAYIPPQSKAFPRVQVTGYLLALADALSRASQEAPHFLLCHDLNAKVCRLNEITHAHKALLVAHPALQLARWCECQAINAAGRLLADLASSHNGILGPRQAWTGYVEIMGRPALWGRLGRRLLAGLTICSCPVPFSGRRIVCRSCQWNTSVIIAL